MGSTKAVGGGRVSAPGAGAVSTSSLSFYFHFCGLAILNARLTDVYYTIPVLKNDNKIKPDSLFLEVFSCTLLGL